MNYKKSDILKILAWGVVILFVGYLAVDKTGLINKLKEKTPKITAASTKLSNLKKNIESDIKEFVEVHENRSLVNKNNNINDDSTTYEEEVSVDEEDEEVPQIKSIFNERKFTDFNKIKPKSVKEVRAEAEKIIEDTQEKIDQIKEFNQKEISDNKNASENPKNEIADNGYDATVRRDISKNIESMKKKVDDIYIKREIEFSEKELARKLDRKIKDEIVNIL